ncbi:hypothetical protein PC9H_011024 [Pleurotus ostreatus]|uniref:DJ-1/PfpI domain-containing protein n=2 Tax=Pleurotus TaxID=5320 RepID=A0A8H7DMI5_PLEOS|nr:uncharacterized protein PC9H_011024 [Pleurotus ostreatus]KAF7422861.1 hypothetical protein PC9H_011024 [Pleurotus ostreatus]KAG9227291.1 hypothetical protein CCMSSC00406_0004170 [Pleurotus cornucopiae]KAJ8691180.1 hypothetical protein PTI98_010775 [Pleurotus ostreatus]
MSVPTNLRLAVCLFDDVTSLDYQGPIALFGFLEPEVVKVLPVFKNSTPPKYTIEITYLAHTLDPVKSSPGPLVVPSRTYDEIKDDEQFDLILIPGGPSARPDGVPKALLNFIIRQAPGAKHILTVCTGSWVLAGTGLLRGKKATTNKSYFNFVVKSTETEGIEWIPKARFVINEDDNRKIWTSSGVTAGMDMANAFLEYLLGKEVTKVIRGVIELSAKEEDEDEFAAYYNLV